MKNLLYLTLGYTVISTKNCFIKQILNIANSNSIKLLKFDVDEDALFIKLYSSDEKRLFPILESSCIGYEIVYRRGIVHLLKKYSHRVGMILGMLFFIAMMYISPLFVWEINISGNEKLSSDYVMQLLEKEGVYIGAFSPKIDRRKIYMNVLKNDESISWISVNFIGSSANVEIIERDFASNVFSSADGANIIAAKDGIIVDAEVIRGRQCLSKGAVVKKGDMLVSGVYETKKMGTRYVYSKAQINAQICDSYTVEIPLNNKKTVHDKEFVAECNIKFFEKNINIFKNYSNSNINYDTIYRKENIPIALFSRLPVSFETVCIVPYEFEPVVLTEAEALERARGELFKKLDTDANYLEIIAIEESYSVENDILILNCNVEAIENIAVTAEFDLR